VSEESEISREPAQADEPEEVDEPARADEPEEIEEPVDIHGWLAFGAHWVVLQDNLGDDADDDWGYELGGGVYVLWLGRLGFAPELHGIFSGHDTKTRTTSEDPFRDTDLSIDRVLVGARSTWFLDDLYLAPYVRAGWMYLWTRGGDLDDEGNGYYAGAGLGVNLARSLFIAPQVLYTRADLSPSASEFLFGLEIDIHF